MRSRSSNWRRRAWQAALLLFIILLAVHQLLNHQLRSRREALKEEMRAFADVLSAHFAGGPASGRPPRAASFAPRPTDRPDGRVLAIDDDGNTLIDTHPSDPPPAADDPQVWQARRHGMDSQTAGDGWIHPTRLTVTRRIGGEGRAGFVRIERSLAAIARDWRSGLPIVAIVSLATLLAALVMLGMERGRWRRLLRGLASRIRGVAEPSSHSDAISQPDETRILDAAVEHARRRYESQAESAERRRAALEAMLIHLREGVVVVDESDRVAMITPSAIRLLGLPITPAAALLGKAIERCIPQLDLQQLVLSRGTGRGYEFPPSDATPDELRFDVSVDDALRHIVARVSDYRVGGTADGARGPRMRLLVLSDITELTRNIQVRADFVTNASHELRTPLSTIRAAVETLQGVEWGTDATAGRRFIDVIDRQSARLEELARDLLNLSRVEAAGSRFASEQVLVAELLRELESQFADQARRRQVDLRVLNLGAPAALQICRPLLRLALDNLIDNALKFTEAGRRVEVICEMHQDSIRFKVADGGCGIAPDQQERVFERFYQVERARTGRDRGTGLGLAIVRHAVQAMGGRVQLESAPGVGTTVTVLVPIAPTLQPD